MEKIGLWTAAQAVNDNQHQQSQFTPVGRLEEQSRYYNQNLHPSAPDNLYMVQMGIYLILLEKEIRLEIQMMYLVINKVQLQVLRFTSRRYLLVILLLQKFVQKARVISVFLIFRKVKAGKEEAENQNEKFYKSLSMSIASTPLHQPPLLTNGISVSMDLPH
ncbi:unnamed protein product [Ilex paraguariensis]|uniref:Uncharacterized protein n=1 Tax=Ilex paraguariensis TaxID=185542 RepID=A0ABC8TW94_9AQUA